MWCSEVEYLKRLEVNHPVHPGMYLRLIHGRKDPDEAMEDWGPNGPFIGPLKWCHVTYMGSINICATDDSGGDGTGPMTRSLDSPMYIHEDMLFYDGMYYGDFELEVFP